MTKYINQDAEFAVLVNAPESSGFRPRTRVFYTEREAERDAYYWFLQGRRLERERALDAMLRAARAPHESTTNQPEQAG